MTDRKIELSRRKALIGLGTIGVAGAGAGVGTSALFSDTESFTNNSITAGTLDMSVTATIVEASEYYTSDGDGPDIIGDMATADGDAVVGLQAEDVKPGDWVIICFEIDIGANPGYVRISTDDFAQYENGQTEPEIAAEGDDSPDAGSLGTPLDGQGEGELQDELLAEVYGTYDSGDDSDPPRSHLADPEPSLSGSARTTYEQFATGVVVGGPADPLAVGSGEDAIERYLLLELPADTGNEVQSDAIEFDLVFETQQVRNNDGFEPSSSLVGYWPLNSVDDGTAEDLSGNGNDGTPNDDVSAAPGQVGGGASFGSDGRITVTYSSNDTFDAQTALSIAAWVYPTGNTSGAYNGIVGSHENSSPYDGWALAQGPGGNIELWSDGTGWQGTGEPLQIDTWQHIVVTRGVTDSNAEVYVDGANVATPAWSPASDNSRPLFIGDRADSEGPSFDGRVDDVRIYDRALSSSEVTTLYNETDL